MRKPLEIKLLLDKKYTKSFKAEVQVYSPSLNCITSGKSSNKTHNISRFESMQGAFTYYVSRILLIFDPLTPPCQQFYAMTALKTHPPSTLTEYMDALLL